MNESETIYALSSGTGMAGVAVVRVSGSAAADCCRSLTGRGLPEPRKAVLCHLREPDGGGILDHALILWFPGPGSFTGEDVLELHLHGGRAVIDGVLAALSCFGGVRSALAGEFTRRAVRNGRMDLIRAEGIGDLIAAETPGQRDQALRQVAGGLSGSLEAWLADLVGVLAQLEAAVDFSDEDLPGSLWKSVRERLQELEEGFLAALGAGADGRRVRDGFLVAIMGAPNVGKSSLLNVLAGSEVAIVAAAAGTTRDVVQTRLVLGGVPVTFADTAGLREGAGEVEREGIRRARDTGERSDLRLLVFDGSVSFAWDGDVAARAGDILVANKVDLASGSSPEKDCSGDIVRVSAKTGEGIEVLQSKVTALIEDRLPKEDGMVLTRARHRDALEDCLGFVRRALAGELGELAAEDVRMAVRALGRVLGSVDVEDVLDVVFQDFCIGK